LGQTNGVLRCTQYVDILVKFVSSVSESSIGESLEPEGGLTGVDSTLAVGSAAWGLSDGIAKYLSNGSISFAMADFSSHPGSTTTLFNYKETALKIIIPLAGQFKRTAASQVICRSNLARVPISVTTMSASSGCATILAPRSSARSVNKPTTCGVNLMSIMLILIPLNIPDRRGMRASSKEDDDEWLADDCVLFRDLSPGILTLELKGITRGEPEPRSINRAVKLANLQDKATS
jgi:hypothetical protein